MTPTIKLSGGGSMPVVGLGLWKIAQEAAPTVVREAIRIGYRHLDAACDYGNEAEVGAGIRTALADGLCRREGLWITSKLWNTYHAPEHVRQMASGKSAELVFENCALRLTDEAVAFIEANRARPFFLYFAPRNIHSPLKPNRRFAGTSEIGAYGDFIHELDWSVGEVLAALERFGVAGNTLVVFSSDNGGVPPRRQEFVPAEVAGHRINGPLRGQKTEVYEGGHRVPFIVRWPDRVKAGMTSDALVANTDVLATCAEILDRPLPDDAGEDSFSFLSALLGANTGQPARSALVTDSMMGHFAIQEGSWKLILGQGGGGYFPQEKRPPASPNPAEPPCQLYHLGEDLGETRNRYAEHPEIAARLTALLEQIRTSGRSRL